MAVKKIEIREIVSTFVFFFLFICIFFPGDPYNLKILFFLGICIFGVKAFFTPKKRHHVYILLMGGIYPIILMTWSALMAGKVYAAVSEAYPAVLILVAIFIEEYGIHYERYMMFLLQLMAITILVIVLMDIIGVINVNGNNPIRNFVFQYDMGTMGKSPAYATYYKIFFKASPLLLVLLPYSFENGRYGTVVLTFAALFFSGTRANIFVATVIFLFGCVNIWTENKKNYRLRMEIGFAIMIVAIIFIPVFLSIADNMMNTSGAVFSDAVRSGQFQSFLDAFSDPGKLILGMGFGSEFFDKGRMAYSIISELAYFDLLRKIGLIWFLLFICFILIPFSWKIGIHLKITYLGYLIVAATNPLLFSSTAYVLYIYLYTQKVGKEMGVQHGKRYV